MLVELSVVEQRYQSVLAVIRDGVPVVQVASRFGGSWIGESTRWHDDRLWFAHWDTGQFATSMFRRAIRCGLKILRDMERLASSCESGSTWAANAR